MTAKEYTHVLNIAKNMAFDDHEAQDLLQEALIVAIKENRLDFSVVDNQKWLVGVIRNKARHEARTASRRKDRNHSFSAKQSPKTDPLSDTPAVASINEMNALLGKLSPAARSVAILVIHGLNRSEICALLGLSSTAFRQRLTTIRKALGPLPPNIQQEVIALAYASRQQRDSQASSLPVGLIRRALLKSIRIDPSNATSAIGTHDPSGHLIIVSPTPQKK